MRLSPRRFRETLTRRREMPGRRDSFGEWHPGAHFDVDLRASIQPIKLEDADLAGGVQLVQRVKAFVLPRRERVGFASAVLLWNGDPLTFHGDPLTWGLGSEVVDRHALAAAFEAASADRVQWDGTWYVVEESRTWPAFTRATLLRET